MYKFGSMDPELKELKAALMKRVSESKARLKASDLAMEVSMAMKVPSKEVKRAMNDLVFKGELEYTFYGDSYIELPLEKLGKKVEKSEGRKKHPAS